MRDDNKRKQKRKLRVRSNLIFSQTRPRLSVHKSNRYIYAQIINSGGNVLLSCSDVNMEKGLKRIERAKKLGIKIAQDAKKRKIGKIVFDRGSYKYHGIVKSLAEGVREGGIDF